MSALATVMQKFTPSANNRRIGQIGLECSLTEMHLVQLEADGTGNLSVYATASVPYPCSRDELEEPDLELDGGPAQYGTRVREYSGARGSAAVYDRCDQLRKPGRIVAQVGVQKHHDFTARRECANARIAGSAVTTDRLEDMGGAVHFDDLPRGIVRAVVAHQNLPEVEAGQLRKKKSQALRLVKSGDDDRHVRSI